MTQTQTRAAAPPPADATERLLRELRQGPQALARRSDLVDLHDRLARHLREIAEAKQGGSAAEPDEDLRAQADRMEHLLRQIEGFASVELPRAAAAACASAVSEALAEQRRRSRRRRWGWGALLLALAAVILFPGEVQEALSAAASWAKKIV